MQEGKEEKKFQEKVPSFFFFCCIFFFTVCVCVCFFSHVLWSTGRRRRSKASSSRCTRSCAPSACGWRRRDESVNRGRLRSAKPTALLWSLLISFATLPPSPQKTSISFPAASSSFLIKASSRFFQKSPFGAPQAGKSAVWARGSAMASICLRVKSQRAFHHAAMLLRSEVFGIM